MAEKIKNGSEEIKAMTRTELAEKYKVCRRTLDRWLNEFTELNIKKAKSILTPAQIKLIFEKIGEP